MSATLPNTQSTADVSAGTTVDVLIVGAGIAGLSLAGELSATCRVMVVERETQPGYHSTGRSAAYFSPAYGNATVRGLSQASEAFYKTPPDGFSDAPLLHARDALHIVPAGYEQVLRDALTTSTTLSAISADKALATVPILNAGYVSAAALESGGGDLDVDAILQGHLRRFKANGGTLLTGSEVVAIERLNNQFLVSMDNRQLRAKVLVNAAGAWADQVASLAGIDPIGLTPKRRTAFLVPSPTSHNTAAWPIVIDQVHPLYFKPDAGTLLLSPMDETPSAACDAAPEELDVAIAADRFQTCTTEQISRVSHQWAGLRTFASDETFVVGFEPTAKGFFWLAGQGGYGVQTAPALSRLAARLIAEAQGFKAPVEESAGNTSNDSEWQFVDAVSPKRFRR